MTQAAFVRSLTYSFVRGWSSSRRTGIGGFFGTAQSDYRGDVIRWTTAQQAAYLIELWIGLKDAIRTSTAEWVEHLCEQERNPDPPPGYDPAFAGRYSILASDQGVRGFLQVCNDISYQSRTTIPFAAWQRPTAAATTDIDEVSRALIDLRRQREIMAFIERLAAGISGFDWRSAVTPGLSYEVETFQSRYRGGSGYKQVRLQLLRRLTESDSGDIAAAAQTVAQALRYDQEWS